ncbi:MAG TPA: prenyltransferase [Gemmataceae bacterium]|nr:prenyltransferase [Gemmataceae bacterium]
MMNRRRFLTRTGVAALGLAGGKLVWGAFPAEDQAMPDGSQARGMITRATQDAIDGGLAYLETQQHADGSFGSPPHRGNVAITSIAGLAFMAGGHQPGRGRYGRVVSKALEFLVNLEHNNTRPGYLFNPNAAQQNGPMYGHGFATLFLAEAYGMVATSPLRERLRASLGRAVQLIISTQNNEGGWRYTPAANDADISVTICQIMALRAAKNAGFSVPAEVAANCTRYVERCQDLAGDGGFRYQRTGNSRPGFARTAAGVVALYSAGIYTGRSVERGLDYLMQRWLPGAAAAAAQWERQEMQMHYYYGHYYAVQAMWIAGGDYWRRWYPAIRDELVHHPDRNADGSWWDRRYFPHCPHYGTAMACIIMQVPNNYLPIFQR